LNFPRHPIGGPSRGPSCKVHIQDVRLDVVVPDDRSGRGNLEKCAPADNLVNTQRDAQKGEARLSGGRAKEGF